MPGRLRKRTAAFAAPARTTRPLQWIVTCLLFLALLLALSPQVLAVQYQIVYVPISVLINGKAVVIRRPVVRPVATPPTPAAPQYFVNSGCATNGNGKADSCATTLGGAGAWNTLASVTSAPLSPGDTVRIHAGTYRERLWPQYGGAPGMPLTYEAYGDGDVIINAAGVSLPAYTGIVYLANSGSVGFVRNVNHLTLRGKPGSLLHITGNSGMSGLVVYANSDRANGNDLLFQHLRVHDIGGGGLIAGSGFRILDSEFHDNGYAGLWVFGPAQHFEIRRSRFFGNDRDGGNTDGLNIQDASFGLLEDLETFGQYDGLDIGSQRSSPGSSFIIVRRVKSHSNRNTNFPNSTTVTGPICFQYAQQWNNYNWGSTVSYENSTNVEYWNSVFDDVLTGINVIAPAPGATFAASNNIFRAHRESSPTTPGTAIAGAAGATFRADHNRVVLGKYSNDVVVGPNSSSGPVTFVDRAARDYRPAVSDTAVIDKGTFFMTAATAVSHGTAITTARDPRTYFWPGDTIQIEGVGTRVVASLGSNTITLTSTATVAAGAGIHLPWAGSAPDIGAYEYSGAVAIVSAC